MFLSQQKNTSQHLQVQGFSLIEVLVSLAIFAIVVTISVGSLMVLLETNARSRGVHEAMTNLSFMLDSMTRDIRTGTYYICGSSDADLSVSDTDKKTADCPGGTPQHFFSFVEAGNSLTSKASSQRIGFHLNTATGVVERRLGNGSWIPVTDNTVYITNLLFYVTGTDTFNDNANLNTPLVTVYISGYMKTRGSNETFDIQTTINQKLLDI